MPCLTTRRLNQTTASRLRTQHIELPYNEDQRYEGSQAANAGAYAMDHFQPGHDRQTVFGRKQRPQNQPDGKPDDESGGHNDTRRPIHECTAVATGHLAGLRCPVVPQIGPLSSQAGDLVISCLVAE